MQKLLPGAFVASLALPSHAQDPVTPFRTPEFMMDRIEEKLGRGR